MKVIALEEHFWSSDFADNFDGPRSERSAELMLKLEEFGARRLEDMNKSGIDVQILSHAPPGGQRLVSNTGVEACRNVNNLLAKIINDHPDRFAGFATLPQFDPTSAADELQRCIEEHGFKGAMLFGLTNGKFLDEQEFWPIFERASNLNVPVYLHPSMPNPTVRDVYYSTYEKSHPALLGAAWGFGIETGTLGIRMILSGIFNKYPDLQVILGHLGEGITFQLERIDEAFSRPGNSPTEFSKTFKSNFHITTSGFFSNTALRCCIDEMGVDRILFAVDWPFVDNSAGVNWLKATDLHMETKAKIFSKNAKKLLSL